MAERAPSSVDRAEFEAFQAWLAEPVDSRRFETMVSIAFERQIVDAYSRPWPWWTALTARPIGGWATYREMLEHAERLRLRLRRATFDAFRTFGRTP